MNFIQELMYTISTVLLTVFLGIIVVALIGTFL
jgi:hypothetical protein